MRKIVSGATVVALALAGVLSLSAAANAEDLAPPPPADATTEVVEVVEPPVGEPAPVAEPPAQPVESAPAPEQAPPPSEPVSEPQEAAPVVEVQTKGGGGQPDFICDESGEGWGPKIDTNGDPATVAVNADEGYLIDAYCVKAGTTKHIVPVVPASATVVVDHPEKDSVSHYQVHQIKKPVVVTPEPRACVGVGAWYTEGDDLAPVATPEGLLFQSVGGKATGYRVPVDGNLQGWESVTFQATGGTEQFFFRIVIDASADGGKSYQSLSFPGYTTINKDSVSYQFGESIAATAARFPNAVVKSVGFQTNTSAPAEFQAVLQSVSGPCATANFVPEVQEPSCTTVTGSQWIEGDGVLSVAGDWATAQIAVPFTGTLADIGTVLDIEASKTQYLGLHIDTAEGTIVFEEEPSYGGNLWSTAEWFGVDAGMGYAAFGSIEEYIAYNGDVQVTGIRLLYTHPEASSTTVESFTIGCTVYTFVPPLPEDTTVPGEWSEPVVDCDTEVGDELTVTRQIVITTYTRGEDGSVVEHVETVTENDVVIVEDGMLEGLECPLPEQPEEPGVVTPAPSPSPTVTPAPASTTPKALAVTGNEMGIILPIGAAALVAFGALGIVLSAAATRNRRAQYSHDQD